MMKNSEKSMDKIIALCKNRGFVFAGSEIYGGLANSWDYGPLGVEFKNNVKKAWLKKFVQESPYNVGLDAAIIMNPQTWITTGHVSSFSDPLLDCKACKARHRADKLIGEEHHEVNVDAMSFDEMDKFIAEHEDIVCPVCGKHDFTPIRKFNLMFKTAIGVTEDSSSTCYLRPETAQGIFVNFANIQRTTRRKLPFGVCQVGKAFRNEITPGNFTFRTREFEQMELDTGAEAQMTLETVQGTRITKRYILGGYQAEYSFRLVYRIHPDNSNDMRLDAEELLNRFGDWASKNLPDLGEGVTARRVEQTTQSAKHVAYTDGDEDYQIMMKLTYEVL